MSGRMFVDDGLRASGIAEVPGPGGEIRFGVGSPGIALSGVWKIRSEKDKADVYITSRALGGVQKISLHESGDWRLQWANKELAAKYTSSDQRVIDQWQRPPEGEGWFTRGLYLAVPKVDYVPRPYPQRPGKPIVWVPPQESGDGVMFHVVIARTGQGFVDLRGYTLVGSYYLSSGEVCYLLAAVLRTDAKSIEWLANCRELAAQRAKLRAWEPSPNTRAAYYSRADDGNRVIWDLSVPGWSVATSQSASASRRSTS